ncbi:hypothetical protein CHS0354_006859 [Potamilus streckersoni]|uniref:Prolyl endopeptidase n=1 Tax=Potamilus streckersoni TaxID=2493646 RepID=A0AAE0WB53_9BIVA|nr:hypothetical protein CHS0354_006859 [Potamilus streckersoni]
MSLLDMLSLKAPQAYKKPSVSEKHGEVRVDYYAWMEKRDTPDVLQYLRAENRYADKALKPFQSYIREFQKELEELSVYQDYTTPEFKRNYIYYKRTVLPGGDDIYCRKKDVPNAVEEIILDTRVLLREKGGYCKVSGVTVTSDNRMMAYGVDYTGRRLYELRFKNLFTGEDSPEIIYNTEGGDYVWAADNRTCFYIAKNTVTLLTERVRKHIVGNDPTKDETVYREHDNRYYLKLGKSNCGGYIMITAYLLGLSSECHLLDINTPEKHFQVFQKRTDDVLYYLQHRNGVFYIRTNLNAPFFRIMKTPVGNTALRNWCERHERGINIAFHREADGYVRNLKYGDDDSTYSLYLHKAPSLSDNKVKFNYSTLNTPQETRMIDADSFEQTLIKRQPVKNYNSADYKTQSLYFRSHDGYEIPVNIVTIKTLGELKKTPDADLRICVFAAYPARILSGDCPHSRQQLFRTGLKNTFYDFISVAEQVIKAGYTASDRLFAIGRSAGGLLMGVVINLRPDLFKAVIAEVPFVDPLNSVLNDDLPLVTNEYHEWGDPRIKEEYDYLKSYAPIPHIFVETGYNDSQVMYFEPAKWVAKLREYKTDNNLLIFRTHMKAGHTGPSDMRAYLKDKAEKLGFIYGIYQAEKLPDEIKE